MNASTFTTRVIASTAAALSGAVGAMSGPLHGGAPARVLLMIEETERTDDPRGLAKAILDRKDKFVGLYTKPTRVSLDADAPRTTRSGLPTPMHHQLEKETLTPT